MTDEETNEPAPTRPRLIDRVLGFRAVTAVALASLILGGVGGAAIGAATSGGDDSQQRGPGQMQFPGGQRPPGFGPGQPPTGGLQPGTTPQDDVQPDNPASNT